MLPLDGCCDCFDKRKSASSENLSLLFDKTNTQQSHEKKRREEEQIVKKKRVIPLNPTPHQ